jgi:putative SOS response-associated peptidase YedK
MKSRRYLVLADGFYEWKRSEKTKQPFCFEIDGGRLFAFAGLWDCWKDPTGQWIKSFSILTTTANAITTPVIKKCENAILGKTKGRISFSLKLLLRMTVPRCFG